MIRQAISCDICGTDKQQTNHWFVAYAHNGELRICDWTSQSRLRSGTRHLCGQTCLHKLVDEFLAGTIAVRPPAADKTEAEAAPMPVRSSVASRVASSWVGTGLTAPTRTLQPCPVPVRLNPRLDPRAAEEVDEFESSARLIPSEPEIPADPAPATRSSTWRSEAWKREREREQRSANRRSIA
ncbi:MAG: hypothetical protein P4L40_11535 [Terracidiphilus sp.]|nr:hypothetical protein [Terracidiphilus sp.]